jgi:exopolyphosphatase/guanosine-5'-triphosphate,3'-diphosphate pyrophosphatase
LPTKLESLDGEQLRRRLRSVAREMTLQPEVVVSKHVKQTFFGGLFGG